MTVVVGILTLAFGLAVGAWVTWTVQARFHDDVLKAATQAVAIAMRAGESAPGVVVHDRLVKEFLLAGGRRFNEDRRRSSEDRVRRLMERARAEEEGTILFRLHGEPGDRHVEGTRDGCCR